MEASLPNLIAWMEQVFVIATLGWLLPVVFRIRHPRTQLAWCHIVLTLCLVLPLAEPWQHPVIHLAAAAPAEVTLSVAAPAAASSVNLPLAANHARRVAAAAQAFAMPQLRWTQIVLWILGAGSVARIAWLLAGLWRIRRYRIGAMPLYPVPESVRAASAITQTDALFCISPHVTGPVMLGWLAPVVLLPEAFLSLEEEAQCGIVCHELLHVRRNDWLVTLLEELATALFWFNPAIWPLMGQTRLAREELVDSEVVRLTASRDPYIDALLTIARGQSVSDLAPAPAPLFLRRRHLTRRMDSLLKEISMSKSRLLSSYGSIAAILALAIWVTAGSLPLVGHPQIVSDLRSDPAPAPKAVQRPAPVVHIPDAEPQLLAQALQPPPPVALQIRQEIPRFGDPRGPSVPVPPDVHELAAGAIQAAVSATDRAAAFALLERAVQNSNMHIRTMSSYELKVSFTAGGAVQQTGSGEMTELWASAQSWRWTASLGGFSMARVGLRGQTADAQPVSLIPMRIQMLRDAIYWAERIPRQNAMIRMAAAQLNGKPLTCMLSSNMPPSTLPTRLWEEEERCIDNESGLMEIYSVAPGTYVTYSYERGQQFHGRIVPDRITAWVNGGVALDAQVGITDLGTPDASLFTITTAMSGASVPLMSAERFPINIGDVSGTSRPVIVHATIGADGVVAEEELSAAGDSSRVQEALGLLRNERFGPPRGTQRDAYINVRFGN